MFKDIDWLDVGMWTLVVILCLAFLTLFTLFCGLIFAAPGYVILLILGESVGFLKCVLVGLGTIILTSMFAGIIYTFRCKS